MTDVAVLNEETNKIVQQPPSESAALISMIERAASDPNVDIDKMERLFQMHERIQERRAVEAYNASMAAAQSDMQAVVRNQENTHTKSKYADLHAIADKALPAIHKHGFGLSFSECSATKEGCISIFCRASHSGGHAETYVFNVPIDDTGAKGTVNKTAVQAYGSTMTYGRRYATCGVFNIQVKDPDGNTPTEFITDDQSEHLKALLSEDGQDMPGFCQHFRIDKVSDLPAAQYSKALAMIDRRKANLAKQEAGND